MVVELVNRENPLHCGIGAGPGPRKIANALENTFMISNLPRPRQKFPRHF